jgi:probable F420-dependent oxidoreductase
MRFALALPNNHHVAALVQPWEYHLGGADLARTVRLADELGFHKVGFGEHFAIPSGQVELSGAHYLQSTTGLAFLAGHTSRLQLSSHVTLVALQNPIVQAKMWAVLDWLSGGRAHMLVGAGWLKEEFDILRVDFDQRGRICDEYIAAMVELWTQDEPRFDGEFISFSDIAAEPKPVQRPHIPLWFAGDAPASLRRVARWGRGWSPYQTPPERFREKLENIASHPDYHGRPVEVWFNLSMLKLGAGHHTKSNDGDLEPRNAEQLVHTLGWLGALGVTEVTLAVPRLADFEAYLDWLRWISADVMPKAREL